MPITTSPAPTAHLNANHVSNRHAATTLADTSIQPSQWSVVTRSVYTAMARGTGGEDVAKLNLPVKRLCAARNALQQALLLIDASITSHNVQGQGDGSDLSRRTYNRLRGLRKGVEKALLEMPLEIK